MKSRLANDEIAIVGHLAHVYLRPSLRAATRLESLHGGYEGLAVRLDEFSLTTSFEMIRIAATDQSAAQALIADLKSKPLIHAHLAIKDPLAAFLKNLTGTNSEPDQDAHKQAPRGKPTPWADYHARLFAIATGWLGWPPEAAWQATPAEIQAAFEGFIDLQNTLNGNAKPEDSDHQVEVSRAEVSAGISRLKQLAGGAR